MAVLAALARRRKRIAARVAERDVADARAQQSRGRPSAVRVLRDEGLPGMFGAISVMQALPISFIALLVRLA